MRFPTHMKSVNEFLSQIPASRLRQDFGMSRPLTDAIDKPDLGGKDLLPEPFKKIFRACNHADPSRLVWPNVLLTGPVSDLVDKYPNEVATLSLNPGSGTAGPRDIGFNMPVEDIRALKQKIDRFALLELSVESEEDASSYEKAQHEFLINNPFVLRNELWGWMTTSSKLVSENADTLQSIEQVLNDGWSPDLDSSNLMGSLNSLISRSKELERIKEKVHESLIYDEFVVMYVPLCMKAEFRLVLREDEFLDMHKVEITTQELIFENKVDRYMHCLVVVPPEKEAVVIQGVTNPKMAAVTTCERRGPVYHGKNEVHGLRELFEICADKVVTEVKVVDH